MTSKRKLAEMSDDELKQIAAEKNRRGNATARAVRAQKELWQRVHWLECEHINSEQYTDEDE